jgi:hypothetical protein
MAGRDRTTADNQVALGDYIYFFRSPADRMTDCAILGHGGHVPDHRFELPANVTVVYQVAYNRPLTLYQGPMGSTLTGVAGGGAGTERHTGPRHLIDQVLTKNLGEKHWEDPKTRVTGQYYLAMEARQTELSGAGQGANWAPHVVTIRNRRYPGSNDAVWLSKVIELVRAHDPTIVTFYPYACRGIVGEKWVKKAGEQGAPR